MKAGGVKNDEAAKPLRVTGTVQKANQPPPIMKYESEVASNFHVIQERREIRHATWQRVIVASVVWFVRKAHSDVIRNDDAILISEFRHQCAEEEGPRGIAVKHDHGFPTPGSLVQVVQAIIPDVQIMASEVIIWKPHGVSCFRAEMP